VSRATTSGYCDLRINGNGTSPRIVQLALAALSEGRVSELAEQFDQHFPFNDHSLGLEFTNKASLTEFFEKSRELFPETTLEMVSLFESGNRAIAEWILAATQTQPDGSISYRLLSNGRTATTKTHRDSRAGWALHRMDRVLGIVLCATRGFDQDMEITNAGIDIRIYGGGR